MDANHWECRAFTTRGQHHDEAGFEIEIGTNRNIVLEGASCWSRLTMSRLRC